MPASAARPDSVTKEILSDGREVWRSEQGEVHAAIRAPGVVVIAVTGHSNRVTYPLMISKVEQEIAAGRRVSWFGDYEKMTTYDPDIRTELVEFTKRHRDKFVVVGILVRSRIIALAVTVANLMVGGFIKVYTSRDAYERAIAEKLASPASK